MTPAVYEAFAALGMRLRAWFKAHIASPDPLENVSVRDEGHSAIDFRSRYSRSKDGATTRIYAESEAEAWAEMQRRARRVSA